MDRSGIIQSLTSLRFFAALAIVFHHARGLVFPDNFLLGVPLAAGVSFFFVLSGFILSYVYTGRLEKVGVYKFYTSRFARLWPAHIFTFALVIIIFPSSEWYFGISNGWFATIMNAFLLHSIVPIPAYYFSFNGVSWSISTELFFYFAFPFLVASFARTWFLKLVVLLVVGGSVSYLFDVLGSNYYSPARLNDFSVHGLDYISPLFRIQEFFIGMLLFGFFSAIKGWKFFNRATCSALEVCFILAVIYWSGDLNRGVRGIVGYENEASGEFWGHIALGVFYGLVIVVFAINKGLVSLALSLRPFVVLGEISFSLYMIHQIVFRIYHDHRDWFSSVPQHTVFPLLFLVALAAAYLMWRFIEMPGQSMLKALFEKAPWALRKEPKTA